MKDYLPCGVIDDKSGDRWVIDDLYPSITLNILITSILYSGDRCDSKDKHCSRKKA